MQIPSLDAIRKARARLADLVLETPTWQWQTAAKRDWLDQATEVFIKLELLQFSGSFKPRGALTVMLNLSAEALQRGVTAISAGNHAIAVSYAAQVLGTHAKVVMPQTTSPTNVERCRTLGAEVVLVEDAKVGFQRVEQIESEEERTFVHPFEGPLTTLGTATLGWEFYRQAERLDAVILPIGGGGLASGMSLAIKQMNPECTVYGVEPTGANTMVLSFQTGRPESIPATDTIALSLAPPFTTPYAFEMCRRHLDEIVLVSDDAICHAMGILFDDLKLAVEPAAATSLAGLLGPLRQRLRGKRVGIITCGANVELDSFTRWVQRGRSYKTTNH